MKLREFNFEERCHIVSLARTCVKKLSSQPLIDYFNKIYRTKFENNGNTIADTIINKYYPDCNDIMRDNLHNIMLEFVFDFEYVAEEGEKHEQKQEDKKYYWNDAITAAKREAYLSDEIYIPENLRGKIEIYIKDNGDVAIRPTDKERLRKVFRNFFIFHNDANKITSSVDEYFDKWYDEKVVRSLENASKKYGKRTTKRKRL